MSSIQQSIIETKIKGLQERWERLTQRLDKLQPARELETRPEEQLRQDHIIAETLSERQQVEAELIKREEELELIRQKSSGGTSVRPSRPDPPPPPPPITRPIEVFYSYSHKDEELRERLETHLKLLRRQRIINDWHDRNISAGTEWAGQIDHYMEFSQIILLLISADFLASDYCWDIEMKRALERHNAGTARVIPIMLRPVDLKGAPFGHLQALPKDAKPVTQWPDRDTAFANIAEGIRKVAEELAGKD